MGSPDAQLHGGPDPAEDGLGSAGGTWQGQTSGSTKKIYGFVIKLSQPKNLTKKIFKKT